MKLRGDFFDMKNTKNLLILLGVGKTFHLLTLLREKNIVMLIII